MDDVDRKDHKQLIMATEAVYYALTPLPEHERIRVLLAVAALYGVKLNVAGDIEEPPF